MTPGPHWWEAGALTTTPSLRTGRAQALAESIGLCSQARHFAPTVSNAIAIQQIAWFVLLKLIRWIAIYPVDSVIQLSNNRSQVYKWALANLILGITL